jgi:uncharacterized protein YutD
MKNFDRNRAVTGRERLAHLDMFFRVACLFGGAILVLTTVLQSQSKSKAEFRPKIPKIWDDAEVGGIEIPLVRPCKTEDEG